MYERIITHNDFDGLVSAAICSHVWNVEDFRFAGPRTIAESKISITQNDIVCDLPYPLECGLWFDHHEGNREELAHRGIDLSQIDGCFALKPSCSRVVYDFYSNSKSFPEHFDEMVENADTIDSFGYRSVEEWRRETPGKKIDGSLKIREQSIQDGLHYMNRLVLWLRDESLDEAARIPEVEERYLQFKTEETQMLELIQRDAYLSPDEKEGELIVLDLTKHNRKPHILKHLAFLLYPEALGVIEVKNMFRGGTKTNDLSLSMSLSLNLNGKDHGKDVGEIMRLLNIGDGHKGAGAGVIRNSSKEEMIRRMDGALKEIVEIWRNQPDDGVQELRVK